MTLEQCQAVLDELRRLQGTDRPMIRVVAGSSIVRGRVARSGSGRRNPQSPFGVLIIEHPGLTTAPASIIQIASIPDDGLSGIESS
jgi:hypothetical protein